MKVAFYRRKRGGFAGIFDWLIRTVTKGPYSHCELIFTNGLAYSSSIQDGGTRFKRIDFDPAHWDFVEVPADEQTVEIFCIQERGCKYDWPGVFRFLWPQLKESPSRWFCSEICCAALQRAGRLVGVNPWQVHPNRLYQLLTACKP